MTEEDRIDSFFLTAVMIVADKHKVAVQMDEENRTLYFDCDRGMEQKIAMEIADLVGR